MRPLALLIAAMAVAVNLASPAVADDAGQWDPTLPKLLSSGAPGDPLAIANASLAATAQATEATMSLGRKFLESMGLVPPSEASVSPGATVKLTSRTTCTGPVGPSTSSVRRSARAPDRASAVRTITGRAGVSCASDTFTTTAKTAPPAFQRARASHARVTVHKQSSSAI